MSDTTLGDSNSNDNVNKKGTLSNKDSGNGNFGNEVNLSLKKEMETSYLSYAMSVIVSRALPDARDGLKPVHRRILYSMDQSGYHYNRAYHKSARIVGDVMGKYHPHGDSAIYESMVRMAQDFSLRLPLIDGQGNFGSMDGDPPAAMRYTEARLKKVSERLLDDLDKETVSFIENYDGSTSEPTVLPSKVPNLLVNGASGIAVGMATNIPPHNLGEVIDGCIAYIDNKDISIDELTEFVKGPDFPTGGIIKGKTGILSAFKTGRGSIVIESKVEIEEKVKDKRKAIVVTEIPYTINKSKLVEKIAEVVKDKVVEDISDIRDESNRKGVRIVVEVKKGANPEIILANLYKHTPLRTSFGVNALALKDGTSPEVMDLKKMISIFVSFREEVTRKRILFELERARERVHNLTGLMIAVNNLDLVIKLIRNSKNPSDAKSALLKKDWPAKDLISFIKIVDDPRHKLKKAGKYSLSNEQADAILDLRLQKLTGLERDKIVEEAKELGKKINDFLSLLQKKDLLVKEIKKELIEVKENFADERRTVIGSESADVEEEDLIESEEMVITVTHRGYIKRVPLKTYRAQKRGGKGRKAMATRDEDFVNQVFVANTKSSVLFFSTKGKVYQMKVFKLPEFAPNARGKPMIGIFPLSKDENITAVLPLPSDKKSWEILNIMFATSKGTVRRNALTDFVKIQSSGKIAMKLSDDDKLIGVHTCTEKEHDVFLSTKEGKCLRFPISNVRKFSGRNSVGVRGIKLGKKDTVISMYILKHAKFSMEERNDYLKIANAIRRKELRRSLPYNKLSKDTKLDEKKFVEMENLEEFILSVADNGYGKRSSAYEYRITSRGGKGIANMTVNKKTGNVVSSFPINEKDDVMLIAGTGKLIRSPVNKIRIAGRTTQGVTLFKVESSEKVLSAASIKDLNINSEE
ncbi:MAG: DNA gyrase subunit A [Alphaproteobacteria bacterium MarineAlpha6_Bin6]|nr:MAG: DNA gyrase subunit A [Alphaproteobacteria bacterium MarineAlpha6_Bin6]PPR33320.1 MAG: DNA gyrase subunit A [Alphaproteobacteria bacterium MarineAlpha6_Bin5]